MLYLRLFSIFAYVSLVGFGGGTAMIPLFEQMLVGSWITYQQLMDIVALSQATPGAFSINLATYVGFISTPLPFFGAFVATMGHAVVGYFLCISVGALIKKYHHLDILDYIFNVLKPLSLSLLIWSAVIIMWNDLQKDTKDLLSSLSIFIICYFFMTTKNTKLRMNPINVIITGAFLGLLTHFAFQFGAL